MIFVRNSIDVKHSVFCSDLNIIVFRESLRIPLCHEVLFHFFYVNVTNGNFQSSVVSVLMVINFVADQRLLKEVF